MKRSIVVCLGLLALALPPRPQSPVAVVEDVQGNVTGAEFMDYVTPKAVIKLGDGGSVVLSYMKSCRRETISGTGTVIVGTDESMVHLADVKAREDRIAIRARRTRPRGKPAASPPPCCAASTQARRFAASRS